MSVTFQDTDLATPPKATIIATEQIGGVEYQQIKLIDPTAASVVPIGVEANPLTVNVALGVADTYASGDLAAVDQTVVVALRGLASAGASITGDGVGSLAFDLSVDDGATWTQVQGYSNFNGSIVFTVDTFPDFVQFLGVGGASHVRVRCASYSSGTFTAQLRATTALPTYTFTRMDTRDIGVNVVGAPNVVPFFDSTADIYTDSGLGGGIDITSGPEHIFAIQVTGVDDVADAWDVRLEGSLDGVNFTELIKHTESDGNGVTKFLAAGFVPIVFYFRSRCDSVTLGGASAIQARILGSA